MDVWEYRLVLHGDVALTASSNSTNEEEEFIKYVTDILTDGEEFDDFIESYFEGTSRKKANMRIDGYAMDDTDGSCCIFISDYHGPYEVDSLKSEDIKKLFNRIRYFVEESINHKLYLELEESTQVYEFSKLLHYELNEITKFRFYILTDTYNKQKVKNIKDTRVADKTVELNVWDITRIFDLVSSKTQKESVEINFEDMGYEGIPCVKAVEYQDVVSDIEMSRNYDDDINDSESYSNKITYTSYLAVVPGEVLNKLYMEHGSRLLEGNVRSFLSIRGKVNKSIQNTIKNYPEMFFAYNNGIAATAAEIITEMSVEGLKITKIKDLQIVNGGQTTASIANTIISARKDEKIDITRLFVPMKVSVLDHSMSEKIIPKISEYSNSQNKVDASDFFSNHPFHIRMEDYSRKTPAPAINGNQFQQFWFYERTRGQYNQGKMNFKAKTSQMKQYENRYPECQVIKMVDLAKYMEIFEGEPHIVSKGKQAIVKVFSPKIKSQWNKSDELFNRFYFKRVIALALIYRKTDEIIKNTDWYKEKKSYKANVVAYTMSILFDYVRTNKKGYTLDFTRIWNTQGVYKELMNQIEVLCTEVYMFITDNSRENENVTEWCKKELCWRRAQKKSWTILDSFINTLILEEDLREEVKDAKAERKIVNEIDDIKFIISAGKDYWQKVLEWGVKRRLLSDMEKSLIMLAINIEDTGRIPNEKQSKAILKSRNRMITEGMPLQF